MDKERKKQLRGILFQHLDGITLCSTIATFYNKRIAEFILKNKTFSMQEVLSKYECNAGYMNVSLRLLSSQGWLNRTIIQDGEDIEFQLTDKGGIGLSHAAYYDTFNKFTPYLINIDKYLFDPDKEDIQNEFNEVSIGSYPYFRPPEVGTNIVLRSLDINLINKASLAILKKLTEYKIQFEEN